MYSTLYEDARWKMIAIAESVYVWEKGAATGDDERIPVGSGYVGHHYGDALSGLVVYRTGGPWAI